MADALRRVGAALVPMPMDRVLVLADRMRPTMAAALSAGRAYLLPRGGPQIRSDPGSLIAGGAGQMEMRGKAGSDRLREPDDPIAGEMAAAKAADAARVRRLPPVAEITVAEPPGGPTMERAIAARAAVSPPAAPTMTDALGFDLGRYLQEQHDERRRQALADFLAGTAEGLRRGYGLGSIAYGASRMRPVAADDPMGLVLDSLNLQRALRDARSAEDRQAAIDAYVASLPPEQQAAARVDPEAVIAASLRPDRAPTLYQFPLPDGTVQTAQYVPGAPDVGFGPGWQPVGKPAPRWNRADGPERFEIVDLPGIGKVQRSIRTGRLIALPGAAGDLTPAQLANNAEIDAAREALKDKTLDDILRAAQPQDPETGLPNAGYNPVLVSLARTAMQHKAGDDPEQADWVRRFSGPTQPAATMPQAGAAAGPQASSAQPAGPRLFEDFSFEPGDLAFMRSQQVSVGGKTYTIVGRLADGRLRLRDSEGNIFTTDKPVHVMPDRSLRYAD